MGILIASASAAPARALQEKNEGLCGTGFFTHYMEYRCTDIGDISDDGKVTDLTESERTKTDALLTKLHLDNDNDDDADKEKDESKSQKKLWLK